LPVVRLPRPARDLFKPPNFPARQHAFGVQAAELIDLGFRSQVALNLIGIDPKLDDLVPKAIDDVIVAEIALFSSTPGFAELLVPLS